jgi:hypothetical protein
MLKLAGLIGAVFVLWLPLDSQGSWAREFDKAFAQQLHLPMTIGELRRVLGRESEFDPSTLRYHWETPAKLGEDNVLNAWAMRDSPSQIETIHILHGFSDFWLIDRFDRHCSPVGYSNFLCASEFPPI